jgi:hypothetical protein
MFTSIGDLIINLCDLDTKLATTKMTKTKLRAW